MIFDVKIYSGFTCKAILFTDVHKFYITPSILYTLVVSRDSARIFLMPEAFNGLDVKCVDVQNKYFNAKPKERVRFQYGQDFGVHKGKVDFIITELYGMMGYGSAWTLELRQLMMDLEFTPCRADGYVWMRIAVDTLDLGEKLIPDYPKDSATISTSSLM